MYEVARQRPRDKRPNQVKQPAGALTAPATETHTHVSGVHATNRAAIAVTVPLFNQVRQRRRGGAAVP